MLPTGQKPMSLATMPTPYTYPDKPKTLSTVQDLIDFITPIPPSEWCVEARHNDCGQHCVLGHIELAYGCGPAFFLPDKLNHSELARVNNGRALRPNSGPYLPHARLTGRAIKFRLLKYLRALV